MVDKSITQEGYVENPELDYTGECQYRRNIDIFFKTKREVLYPPTRLMYEFIRDFCIDHVKNHPQYPKYNWKPKIVDVACGGGFGSYILSQEADYVWGIDKSTDNIAWCKVVFERHKNGIYYSPQMTFDLIDVLDEPRELAKFDIVACIELIEHVDDYQKLLAFLKRFNKTGKNDSKLLPPDATTFFISSPNRNHSKIRDDKPKNKRHVREWTPAELYGILTEHFESVTLMNPRGETRGLDMTDEIQFYKCEVPK